MNPMSVEAIYEQGTLKLPQALPLPDGQKVRIEVVASEGPTLLERFGSVIGKAKHLPPDAAHQHDHYLYGGSTKDQPR